MVFAGWLVFFAKGYALAGCIVAAAFLLFGIDRVDASSRGAYSFRPLIIPGLIVLWPLVVIRWWRAEQEE
jgi:hypothetical protein